MALSRRMAIPFFAVLLVIVVAAETATARDVVGEKICLSKNSFLKGARCDIDPCILACKMDKFTGGVCKGILTLKGILSQCYCKKVC